jgi:hypothetical protein
MNRELLEQALAALQHMINNTRAMSEYNPIIVIAAEDALKAELAKPEEDRQMEITVRRKTLYGNDVVYPVCDTAKNLTMLGDTKTLTQRQIGIIKALGYKIVLEQQEEV